MTYYLARFVLVSGEQYKPLWEPRGTGKESMWKFYERNPEDVIVKTDRYIIAKDPANGPRCLQFWFVWRD